MEQDIDFKTFKRVVSLSMEDMCRDLFLENPRGIKIKKEGVAVKNLVKIFNAALAISNEKGFAAMSLRDLSAEAGLSMGALYTYFSSKDELLDMITHQGRMVTARVLLDQIDGIDNPRARLKRAIEAHLFLSEIMQPWFYFSYMETKNLSKTQHRKAIETELFTEKIFVDIISSGCEQGLFRAVNVDLAGAALKALLQDWYLKRWKYAKRGVTVENYAFFITDLMETYLFL
ncbi:MAG: TetR/AcrR family transcriptional regulator [Desulfomonilia bacterium]|nr:TetR/AcrR family transcriptional regulator [Desulfomonilia bacterium]